MALHLPADFENLVQRRLAQGGFADAEESEESWTVEERAVLNLWLDRSIEQANNGQTYSPEESQQRLAEMRSRYLSGSVK